MFDDKSIDDELAGFISKHRIGLVDNNEQPKNDVNYNDLSEILPDEASEFQDNVRSFIPSYEKLSKLLENSGFKLVPIEPNQIDTELG